MTAFLLVLSVGIVSAQNVQVKGTVKDAASGESIPFVSVVLKGTMTGTSADLDGAFALSVPSDGVLVFSNIGYTKIEVPVSGRSVLDVTMSEDAEFLDDVIVIAYGTATKESFTGSASMVKSEEISKKISTSVTSALAGSTPGVQLISSSGDPTSNGGSIRIRGIGSMEASSAPLIVLDGVPFEGQISDINPNDVESMSVLKDASASAIYGHRGANGVVLITTKKAKAGEATVRFDSRFGSNSRLVPNYDVIDNPAQYYETYYTLLYNSYLYAGYSSADSYAYADKTLFDEGNGGLGYQVYTVPEGEKFIGTNFKLNPNATLGYTDGEYYYTPDNWYDETFHNSFRQEYNLSISGSSDKFNYYASAGFLDDGGSVSNSNYKRYTARVNTDYQVKPWFKLITNMGFTHSNSQSASYDADTFGSSGSIFYIVNNMGPIYPLYVRNADGSIKTDNGRTVYDSNNTNFKRPNFVGNAVRDNENDKDLTLRDSFTGKWGVVLTPVKGLSIQANVGVTADNSRNNFLGSIFGSAAAITQDGYAFVQHERLFTINQQFLAEYKTDFNGSDHNFDILAGYEQYNNKNQVLYGSNDHLFNPTIGELSNADGTSKKNVKSYTNSHLSKGFLARAQYDYQEKYFFSTSYRRDASSYFAPGHQWGNFYSVGLGWLISEEDFMMNVESVDMLKLKASYGVQGNDNLGAYYPYSDSYEHQFNEETGEYSLALKYKGNTDLTWETSKALNYGLDFELFKGYLNGSLELFSRKTEDLLYMKDVPLSAGNPTGEIPVNVGSILNKGFELTVDGNIINNKNFSWTWNANFSHYNNSIVELDESVSEKGIRGGNFIYAIGGSLYNAYVRKYAGVDPESGAALYYYQDKDEDGNYVGEEKTSSDFSLANQFDVGSVLPKLYGGFGTAIRVFDFDASIQLSYQLGGRFYDGSYQALMHTQKNAGQAMHKDQLNAWTPENTDTDVPRLDGDIQVAQTAVDRFLVSSNYLSINNVTIGYTLPAKLSRAISMQSLRLYVAGENLALFTARQGVDPRASLGLGSYSSGSGLNTGRYGTMRNITAGITLTF